MCSLFGDGRQPQTKSAGQPVTKILRCVSFRVLEFSLFSFFLYLEAKTVINLSPPLPPIAHHNTGVVRVEDKNLPYYTFSHQYFSACWIFDLFSPRTWLVGCTGVAATTSVPFLLAGWNHQQSDQGNEIP